MTRVSLSAVIVAHDSLVQLRRSLPALVAQLDPGDELIVVDNASGDDLEAELYGLAPQARLIRAGANVGFAAGVNRGAEAARGDLLVLLNPDAVVQEGWAAAIRVAWRSEFAAWMGVVLMNDVAEINTTGGVLHFTGFGWAGQVGEPASRAPRAPTPVGFLSGACLAIPLDRWRSLGGFSEWFFMYCEDVDLSLRLRLQGAKLAVIPSATVAHDYEFAKGQLKWRLLERNRWAMLIRTYPGPLLVLLTPALLATEAAVWAVAVGGGWTGMKARASVEVLRALPRLLRERRAIQASACVTPLHFATELTASLDSPYFGSVGSQPLLRAGLASYWSVVLWLLARI